jgi:hypothetical protein
MQHEELEKRIRELTDLICQERHPEEVKRLAAELDKLLEERGILLAQNGPGRKTDGSGFSGNA